MKYSFSWKKRKVLGDPDINKIPALMRNDPPFNEPEMEHKHKRRSAQKEYQEGLTNDKKEEADSFQGVIHTHSTQRR